MSRGTDPGSLSRLHDIVLPQAVSWWPLAPGWYILGILALLMSVLGIWWSWRRRQKRRYRRQALAELQQLRNTDCAVECAAAQILVLLKRTALAVYPRAQVAGLSGDQWWAFLDRTAPDMDFAATFGPMAAQLAYASGADAPGDDSRLHILAAAAERWIVTHRGPAPD